MPFKTSLQKTRLQLDMPVEGPFSEGAISTQQPKAVSGPSAKTTATAKAKIIRIFVWSLQILLAIAAGVWLSRTFGSADNRMELPPLPSDQSTNAEAIPVTISSVTPRNIVRSIEAVGNLHGFEELTLKSKISGRVARIYHDFADRVKAGDLLMEIDPTDALLAVEQAKSSLNSELAKWGFDSVPLEEMDVSALPTVVSGQLKATWAKDQYNRLSALQTRGSVTAQELEEARTNALVGESDYTNLVQLARAGAATAQLKKAELDIAEQQLKETKISVPMRESGYDSPAAVYTITDRYVTEGAWLAVGTDLFRMVIDETLKLRLPIPEQYAPRVQLGQRVEVSTPVSSLPAVGTITRIGPAVDHDTRTFQIEAEVSNVDRRLKTGSFSVARVIVEEASSAVTVPASALVTFAGIHKIFIVDGQAVKEYRVKLGEQSDDWVEIIDPQFPATAMVVVTGNSQLADGTLVRIRQTAEKAESNKGAPQ